MSRSRNLKPGFFKNDRLAECDPLARILYQGLWCEADRAGRLEDRPRRLKAECLPYDDCDIESLLGQLQSHGFIVRYQRGEARYIAIPTFGKHQNPHVKEVASSIPEPGLPDDCTGLEPGFNETCTEAARLIPSSLIPSLLIPDSPLPPLKEKQQQARGSRLPDDWCPSEALIKWAQAERPDLVVGKATASFLDYWHGVAGAKGRKLDWDATFRNWIRDQRGFNGKRPEPNAPAGRRMQTLNKLEEMKRGLAKTGNYDGLPAADLPLLGSPTRE